MAKPELKDHRKFKKLVRLLNEPVAHIVGYLECMWHTGYQIGTPFLGDSTDVEAAAGYPHEPGKFTTAALEAGFIDAEDGGNYSIHDLFEHAPKYAKMRMKRKGTAPTEAHACHTTAQTCHDDGKNGTDVPHHGTDVPENGQNGHACATKPRAEILDPKAESQEPKPKPKPKAEKTEDGGDLAGNGQIRFDFKTGEWHGITNEQRAIWAKAYPAVDLEADLAKAAAWCVANPKEGTKSNYGRFLANWFSRTQDRGGNRTRDSPKGGDLGQRAANTYAAFVNRGKT